MKNMTHQIMKLESGIATNFTQGLYIPTRKKKWLKKLKASQNMR